MLSPEMSSRWGKLTVTSVSPFGASGIVGSALTRMRLMSISGGWVSGLVVTSSMVAGASSALSPVNLTDPSFSATSRMMRRVAEYVDEGM